MNFLTRFLLALIITFSMSQCVIVRSSHNDRIDLGFMKNKGEGSIGGSFDTNDETSGLNAGVMFSPVEHLLIGAGVSTFSYRYLHRESNIDNPNFDFDDDKGNLKGNKFRVNLGYYLNFGADKTNYLETMLTGSYGNSNLKLAYDGTPPEFEYYNYSPVGIAAQVGLGKNLDAFGFLGGIKFQYYDYQQPIPLIRDSNSSGLSDDLSVLEVFMAVRFGKGPVKASAQLIFGNNLSAAVYNLDPIPAASIGIHYVFGRKRITEMSF